MHELGEAAKMFVYLKVFETLFGLMMLMVCLTAIYFIFWGKK